MDASKLPPPAAAAPAHAGPVSTSAPDAATVMDGGAMAIGGRFLVRGSGTATPTGALHDAHDTQAGGAQVWVKLVSPEALPNANMADRALRELKQLSKVQSDRLLKVIDQGKSSDGKVYVATEMVSAPTLEALVKKDGPLPADRAMAIVLQVGEALTEAQKVGVIHRDVAPRNIFVLPGDKAKVAEFGLAEPVNDKVFGAPGYVSPEQVEGKPVDQRSNIYSLGAVFYYALTGHAPFEGDSASLLHQHQTATPQAPSAKKPGLPAEVDRIILKALEKSGGRRHLTLRQLLTEIEAVAHGKAPSASAAHDAGTAKTMMGIPPPMSAQHPVAAPHNDAKAQQATVMGIPTPATSHAPATTPMAAAAPVTTAPSMPAAPSDASLGSSQAGKINASEKVQAALAAAQATVAAKKAAEPAAPAKGGFRETAWFKAGEIKEELEKAEAAAAQASGGDVLKPTGSTDQHKAVQAGGDVDLAKVDVDAQDKARLSLKTGATQMMSAVKMPQSGVPGERMDEKEMLAEIDSSKKLFLIAGAIVGVVVIAVILYFVLGRNAEPKAEAPPAPAPTAVAAAPPTPNPKEAAAPAVAPSPTPTAAPKPAPPTTPPPTAAASPDKMLADANAALGKDNLGLAVDLYTKAVNAGAPVKAAKRTLASLDKAVGKRIAVAHKKKDKEGEAEAKALQQRLKSLTSSHPRRRP